MTTTTAIAWQFENEQGINQVACDACADSFWTIWQDDDGWRAYATDSAWMTEVVFDVVPLTELPAGATCETCKSAGTTAWTGTTWLSNVAEYPHLIDAESGDRVGVAGADAIIASATAGHEGIILVDDEGNPVAQGSWRAQNVPTRRVYVR